MLYAGANHIMGLCHTVLTLHNFTCMSHAESYIDYDHERRIKDGRRREGMRPSLLSLQLLYPGGTVIVSCIVT
jgi:hypothetical protein